MLGASERVEVQIDIESLLPSLYFITNDLFFCFFLLIEGLLVLLFQYYILMMCGFLTLFLLTINV